MITTRRIFEARVINSLSYLSIAGSLTSDDHRRDRQARYSDDSDDDADECSRSIDGIGRVEHTCAVGDDEYVRWHQRLVMIRYWWRPGPGAGVPGSVGGIGVAVNDSFGSCEIEWYLALARWFLAYHPATPRPPKKARETGGTRESVCVPARANRERDGKDLHDATATQASKQATRAIWPCVCVYARAEHQTNTINRMLPSTTPPHHRAYRTQKPQNTSEYERRLPSHQRPSPSSASSCLCSTVTVRRPLA